MHRPNATGPHNARFSLPVLACSRPYSSSLVLRGRPRERNVFSRQSRRAVRSVHAGPPHGQTVHSPASFPSAFMRVHRRFQSFLLFFCLLTPVSQVLFPFPQPRFQPLSFQTEASRFARSAPQEKYRDKWHDDGERNHLGPDADWLLDGQRHDSLPGIDVVGIISATSRYPVRAARVDAVCWTSLLSSDDIRVRMPPWIQRHRAVLTAWP